MAFLVVEKGDSKDIGKTFPLGDGAFLIGRETAQGVPDIAVDDDFVSRRHAEIRYDQGQFLLRDLGSTNGTTVDQQRAEPGTSYRLVHDAVIGLAPTGDTARILLRFKETPTISTARIEIDSKQDRTVAWLEIERQKQEVRVDGKQVTLSRKEYDLLVCLQSASGAMCTRDELISCVWPEAIDPSGVSDAAIDQLVHRLRIKVEPDPARPIRIVSRKGFGYMLL